MNQELLPIDEAEVQKRALGGATDQDLAAYFGCTVMQFRERFGAIADALRAQRRIALRNWQTRVAARGNAPMLIWLGKNELGQTDRPAPDTEPEPELDSKVG
jgi:hypothetical protein